MINIYPIATEKSYTLQTKNTYMFEVPMSASKQLIAAEVAEQFKVGVVKVTTQVRKGKKMRFSRGKRAYPGTTYRQDKKFAFVTLKDGDSIKVFDEEVKTDDKAAKKTDEKVTKVDAAENAETKKAGLAVRRRTGRRGDK